MTVYCQTVAYARQAGYPIRVVANTGSLGGIVRKQREDLRLTQAELATRAGVGRTTIRDAELGKDFQLTTLVKLLRALGRLGDLDAFLPAPSVSPIQLMKRQGKPRRRARKPADG